ncbi:MAG: flavodoxin domain-containing protein [Armatimonadota bacterium]
MAASVLVAYATKYGSTGEVAKAVAETLRARGITVDVRRAKEVRSLEGYQAVVVGAPLYIGNFLGEARKFLERHRAALERLPVAVFSLGPLSAGKEMEEARPQLTAALEKMPWLKPVAVELFVGSYDPASLRFPYTLLATMKASPLYGMGKRDERDWDAIRAWAETLPAALHLS